MRVECFAQEHKTKSLARARTRTARSGLEHTNLEATVPFYCCFLEKFTRFGVTRNIKMKQTKRSRYRTTTLIPSTYLSTKSTFLCLQSGRCGEVQTEVSKLICKYVNLLFSQVKVIIRTIVISTL